MMILMMLNVFIWGFSIHPSGPCLDPSPRKRNPTNADARGGPVSHEGGSSCCRAARYHHKPKASVSLASIISSSYGTTDWGCY